MEKIDEKIDGKIIAEKIYQRVGDRQGEGICAAIIMIGADAATESFVTQKKKAALRTGIDLEIISLKEETTTEDMAKIVKKASDDSAITAVITQLPFPSHIDREKILLEISPDKDADVLNGGECYPPSVGVILEIMNYCNRDISVSNFVIVGYGELVGKPAYKFLAERARSARLLRRGDNLADNIAKSDVIILGTGSPRLVGSDMIRDGAIVIDFGYGLTKDSKLSGDFNPKESNKKILYTPVPGGTGPILVAKLFENIVALKK